MAAVERVHRVTFERELADANWEPGDERWFELEGALLFIRERHKSDLSDYYAFRRAAGAAWRLLMHLPCTFQEDAELDAFAIVTRELETIGESMRAMLADRAHESLPLDDDD